MEIEPRCNVRRCLKIVGEDRDQDVRKSMPSKESSSKHGAQVSRTPRRLPYPSIRPGMIGAGASGKGVGETVWT